MPSNKNLLQQSSSNIQLSADSDLKPKITIGFQLAKILKLKRRFIDIEMKELGLSRTGWQVLFWLTILAPCSQKELLKNLDIDAGHLARVKLLAQVEENVESVLTTYIIKDAENNG